MDVIGLILLNVAVPLLVEQVRLLLLRRRVWLGRMRSRSIFPANWRECDWIVVKKGRKS
jgi:hypothetical protein